MWYFMDHIIADVKHVRHRHKHPTSEVAENERSLTMFEFDCLGAEALGGKKIDEKCGFGSAISRR